MASTAPADREEREAAVLALAEAAAGGGLDEVLEGLAAALHDGFAHYTGVYFYWLGGGELALRSFRGRATEHVRIPVGQGICGRAAREARTVVVDDVNADPAYLACSLETRSEIVVPVMRGGEVLGEIDIDSDVPAAFTPVDRVFLERLAALIAARADAGAGS
jgi:L-methionine (R)-S-oxide reductase